MKRDKAQTEKVPLSRIQKRRKGTRSATHTVSFRLDGEYLSKLDRIGEKRGLSIHEQARAMVMALLDGDEAELLKIRDEMTELRAEVEALREGLQPALIGLVHSISKLTGENLSLEDAEAFIKTLFRRREKDKHAVH
jgi:hypothetical protein